MGIRNSRIEACPWLMRATETENLGQTYQLRSNSDVLQSAWAFHMMEERRWYVQAPSLRTYQVLFQRSLQTLAQLETVINFLSPLKEKVTTHLCL